MAEFVSFDRNVGVAGPTIVSFIAGFPRGKESMGASILERHGIKHADESEWHDFQSFLDAMKEISERMSPYILTRIGEQISVNARLPPGLDTLEKFFSSMDAAYHMNHRNGEIGHYHYFEEEDTGGLHRIKMVCPNPYPCALDLGIIEGFAARFKPPEASGIVVRHDDSQPCRRKGAEACTYLISWG